MKSQNAFDVHKAEWIRRYNPEALFQDESYKKHLKHQCNKLVLGGGAYPKSHPISHR